jgi:hypothetical protein
VTGDVAPPLFVLTLLLSVCVLVATLLWLFVLLHYYRATLNSQLSLLIAALTNATSSLRYLHRLVNLQTVSFRRRMRSRIL